MSQLMQIASLSYLVIGVTLLLWVVATGSIKKSKPAHYKFGIMAFIFFLWPFGLYEMLKWLRNQY